MLGTLCIIDDKLRKITESQKNALMLLAKKAMSYMESRKLMLEQRDRLKSSVAKQKKLTDQAPGVIFQLEIKPDGCMSFPFMSQGISEVNANLNPADLKANPKIALSVIHSDDLNFVEETIRES